MNDAAKSTATAPGATPAGLHNLRTVLRSIADHLTAEVLPAANQAEAMGLVEKRIAEMNDRQLAELTRAVLNTIDSSTGAPLDDLEHVSRTAVEGFAGWFGGSLIMGRVRTGLADLGTQKLQALWRSVKADAELLRPIVNGPAV